MKFLSRHILVACLLIVGFCLVITAMEKPTPPGQKGIAAKQPAQPVARKFEFANQSDEFVTVWIPKSKGCWQPILIHPSKDSGILNPIDGETIYIYTKAKGYFEMIPSINHPINIASDGPPRFYLYGPDRFYLHRYTPSGYEDLPLSERHGIKEILYDEVRDIIVIINSNGEVDFSHRFPQQ